MKHITRISLICAAFWLVTACTALEPSKPAVILSSPASGSQYQVDQEVAVQSTSGDTQGITSVELFVDGQSAKKDAPPVQGQAQFTVIQTWRAAAPGPHRLTVRATNSRGATGEAGIDITVLGPVTSPTVGGLTPIPSIPVPISTATLAPTVPATAPPPPPATAVPSGPTATSAPVACANNSEYVADITVPDGAVIQPGTTFVKTWRVRNNGTCTWDNLYTIAFTTGEQFGAPSPALIPSAAPGAVVDISISMVAPQTPGPHTSVWKLMGGDTKSFGTNLTAVITIPGAPPPATSCPNPPAVPSFTASPSTITAGGTTTLSWGAVTNATAVTIDQGIGGVATPGSRVISPATTTIFTLTAVGCGGTTALQLTVTVNPAPTRTPSVSTYKTGPLSVPQTYIVDLDNGLVGVTAGGDWQFEAVTATERYLTPLGTAKIAKFGTSAPSVYDCMNASLSGTRIKIADAPVGTYICVKTDQGRYAEFRVNSGPGASPGTLGIGYTTWTLIP